MNKPAIRVSDLSKRYIIKHESQFDNLRDTLHHQARKLWRRIRWGTGFNTEEFWALTDISFSVRLGEIVGIIGHNGAGKSTLLKTLSRITEPTTGEIELNGRVASLLEVGTGFHPELTGRENIYLNGAILGMSRKEITSKFEEIVSFAEIERFLDTPVKRYSSGMYVRLAFAVAAHLDPDILIVDEVLAVGDAAFQKKCLGKIRDISNDSQRAVLFVSHNIATVLNLCNRAILLSEGKIIDDGPVEAVAEHYLGKAPSKHAFDPSQVKRIGTGKVQICDFKISPSVPNTGTKVEFTFVLERMVAQEHSIEVELAIAIQSRLENPILQIYSAHSGVKVKVRDRITTWTAKIDALPLVPDDYNINLWVGQGNDPIDWIKNATGFQVGVGAFGQGNAIESRGYPVVLPAQWTDSTELTP